MGIDLTKEIEKALQESADLKQTVVKSSKQISEIISVTVDAVLNGYTLFVMGNGGSAADAQHIAGELVGRFKHERTPIPAIALSTDTSIITAIGNDYSFEEIFSRQINALARKGDVALGISTSGNSKNVKRALEVAKQKEVQTIAFLGGDGGEIKDIADFSLVVPSRNTPRVQEAHITVGHILCNEVEKRWVNAVDHSNN